MAKNAPFSQIDKDKRIGELKKSEEKYRTAVENANEGIFVAQDWVLKFSNPKTSEILGYTAEELKVKPFAELIHPEDRAMVAGRHKRRLQGQTLEDVYEFRAVSKDQKVKWVELKPVRIMWENKPATLNFMSDITRRKEEEAARKKLESQLRHSQKMEAIGTLAGGIAHDFNNILGAILGYTELSIDELPEESLVRANLEHVLSAAGRAKELIKQILAFSRKGEQERKPIYIVHIIKEALKLLRSSLPATIELKSSVRSGLRPVMADPTRIHQVMMNLCTNAAYAMREKGGFLDVALKEIEMDEDALRGKGLEPGTYQLLSVTDTGTGMDEETRRRIFEPYFTTKEESEGTGLGMAVVHGIVTSHNGSISVYSEPRKGTTVNVLLPVTRDEEKKGAYVKTAVPGGNERILLVDDEFSLADLLKQMLERMGYVVEMETDSFEALETFRSNPDGFDLILTDQTMPGMTGIQLTEAARELNPGIPVILTTGFSENVDEKNFQSMGIDAFVMKPVTKKDIAPLIRKVLEKK